MISRAESRFEVAGGHRLKGWFSRTPTYTQCVYDIYSNRTAAERMFDIDFASRLLACSRRKIIVQLFHGQLFSKHPVFLRLSLHGKISNTFKHQSWRISSPHPANSRLQWTSLQVVFSQIMTKKTLQRVVPLLSRANAGRNDTLFDDLAWHKRNWRTNLRIKRRQHFEMYKMIS
jgi:hypothetical protein